MSVLEIKNNNGFYVLKVNSDRLDAASSPELKTCVTNLVNDGARNLIIDISQVNFMDSSALGAIVSALKLFDGKGEMLLVGASGVVLDLFKLTRMDRVLSLYDDFESAEKSLVA